MSTLRKTVVKDELQYKELERQCKDKKYNHLCPFYLPDVLFIRTNHILFCQVSQEKGNSNNTNHKVTFQLHFRSKYQLLICFIYEVLFSFLIFNLAQQMSYFLKSRYVLSTMVWHTIGIPSARFTTCVTWKSLKTGHFSQHHHYLLPNDFRIII